MPDGFVVIVVVADNELKVAVRTSGTHALSKSVEEARRRRRREWRRINEHTYTGEKGSTNERRATAHTVCMNRSLKAMSDSNDRCNSEAV